MPRCESLKPWRSCFAHLKRGKYRDSHLTQIIAAAPGEPWVLVDLKAVRALPVPVGLKQVKATPALSKMSLVTSMRLSVQPVTDDEWALVCRMGGL